MSDALTRMPYAPSASATIGRSFTKICSCSARVAVETITFLPLRTAGTRYASVLPVPVPASTSRCFSSSSATSTAWAIASWPSRISQPGSARDRGESGPRTSFVWMRPSTMAEKGSLSLAHR